ncbi:PepSY-like domain-containing protein [Cyclobacterium marinum]|uniref:Putative beta-lactamase-inhibitor-like PepSY-like domain-containing protein n=1 Tax=Cyclobacterium marinum (strain ATCC 25205 / DSM 745 / LMG 13164 / NCIMB 1802) TaxID=880070 RepID=G0J2I9_CYCMS|nr:PepSY-like domain-containing protein [Cyclobacterium marinum]AEL25880.1 hypothetical protein Cycma_2135 [Cyclobacterium marinum DSM 745]
MKKQLLIIGAFSLFGFTQAQDISQDQVPSLILNQFKADYAKASDIEWEKEGEFYSVEFETGWNVDHEIWYNAGGDLVKHKEDIPTKELPIQVKEKIKEEFSNYSIDDLERISEEGKVVYKMELNSIWKQDWEVVIDAEGGILNKVAD